MPTENVENSILNSVKHKLGYPIEMHEFDSDIILDINAAIATLTQVGVGPSTGFMITNEEDTYEDFVGSDYQNISMVFMYLYLKTKLAFDPPSTSYLIDIVQKQAEEYYFRLQIHNEHSEI